jgi:hypothetical protein
LTIHDAGVHEGAPSLVSELLRGQILRKVLDGSGAVSAPTAAVAERGYRGLPLREATDFALEIA